MTNLKARKIATLIKFSRLPYTLEEAMDEQPRKLLLTTPQGELEQEYEIINYLVMDCLTRTRSYYREPSNSELSEEADFDEQLGSFCGADLCSLARMNEQLMTLRGSLFPLLEEFYQTILGYEPICKSKYHALLNRIKKQIMSLDELMSEHGHRFGSDGSFLSIIIACELFIGCRFVFEEKFRKTRRTLFNLCEKIARRPEFEEVYGKTAFCGRECLRVEFSEEEETEVRKVEETLPVDIVRLSELPAGYDKRNELLYNFFQSTLKGQESKSNYFPYFWMMYDHLAISLVELHYQPPYPHQESYPDLEKQLFASLQELPKLLKPIDYGFMAIYNTLNENHS